MDSQARNWVSQALREHEQPLTRYVTRFVGGRNDLARDIVQHAYLMLCRQDHQALGDNVAAWLYRTCRNRALDELRKQKMSSIKKQFAARENVVEPNPQQSLEQSELLDGLLGLISELPAEQREAVDLWSNGLRYRDIGELIGKSEVAVRVSVHRAIKQLRDSKIVRAYLAAKLTSGSHAATTRNPGDANQNGRSESPLASGSSTIKSRQIHTN